MAATRKIGKPVPPPPDGAKRYTLEEIEQREAQAMSDIARRPKVRELREIARDIRATWVDRNGNSIVYFGAVPYLRAMGSLGSIDDMYGLDTARSIVLYFLSNAATWRGDDARRVRAELKGMLKL